MTTQQLPGKDEQPIAVELGEDMPKEAGQWAIAAAERKLAESLSTHNARIPEGLLQHSEGYELIDLPRPWGAAATWTRIAFDGQLTT